MDLVVARKPNGYGEYRADSKFKTKARAKKTTEPISGNEKRQDEKGYTLAETHKAITPLPYGGQSELR
ncbi:hypothetical protein V1477_018466 [Vespula maculifrons]|uniref:Uncharacterized protein n=2 Tax=Vespula TaxID=7451 RepID=A0A834NJZ0_VESVU|nr:hypothetical protein HZH66_001098 [Vespula vulgaris]